MSYYLGIGFAITAGTVGALYLASKCKAKPETPKEYSVAKTALNDYIKNNSENDMAKICLLAKNNKFLTEENFLPYQDVFGIKLSIVTNLFDLFSDNPTYSLNIVTIKAVEKVRNFVWGIFPNLTPYLFMQGMQTDVPTSLAINQSIDGKAVKQAEIGEEFSVSTIDDSEIDRPFMLIQN